MTDRFFAEIEDPRERRVLEAFWEITWRTPPNELAKEIGAEQTRSKIASVRWNEVRQFLAMLDAALTMPEDEHRAMIKRLNNEPDDSEAV